MKRFYLYIAAFSTLLIVYPVSITVAIIPSDVKPINAYDTPETHSYPVFLGSLRDSGESVGETKLEDFQGMKQIGDHHFIYARNYIFVINLKTQPSGTKEIHHQQALNWTSEPDSVSLCIKKGQSRSKCSNFIKVFEEVELLRGQRPSRRMIVCSTNAFNPNCRYYELAENGKLTYMSQQFTGMLTCPFDPSLSLASRISDGNLYTATQAGFSGHDSLLHRSSLAVGNQHGRTGDTNLRTARGDTTWLNSPRFVRFVDGGMSLNKLYAFFTEVAVEDNSYQVYTRVGQVCKNDQGGRNILRNQYSSFFKARLNCSLPGQPPFYFNEMRDVTDLVTLNSWYQVGHTKVVFAIMNTPSNSIPASAICAFTLPDIETSMNGPFLERYIGEKNSQPYWEKQDSYPIPHLARCDNDPRHLSDIKLNFVRKHPLMYDSVNAWNFTHNTTDHHDAMPLYTRTSARNFLTSVAVDTAAGIISIYTVLITGTEDGKIIKLLLKTKGESMVIEERSIFNEKKCGKGDKSVRSIILDKTTGTMLVAFKNCVIQAPLCPLTTNCERKCIQSRDPYCGWDGKRCVTVDSQYPGNSTSKMQPRQDIEAGVVVGTADCEKTIAGSKDSEDITPIPAAGVGSEGMGNNTSSHNTTVPLVKLQSAGFSSWMIPALIALLIGLVMGVIIGVVFCMLRRKCCAKKLMTSEKHVVRKITSPNGHSSDARRASSQSNTRSVKSRHPSTSSHPGKNRMSTHEDSRRQRKITDASRGSHSDEESAFVANDQLLTPVTPSVEVTDGIRSKQIKSTSSSQGGRRRTRNSKPSTSSGPEHVDHHGSPQKTYVTFPIGEGPPGYQETFKAALEEEGQPGRQGSDSGHSSEGITTPADVNGISTHPYMQHKLIRTPARAMSFQGYAHNPNLPRTYSMGQQGASTVGYTRPNTRAMGRQHSLQVADTMPGRYHAKPQPLYVTIAPQMQTSHNVPSGWVNQPQVPINNPSPNKNFESRRPPMANMTHSLDRRKMLKGQPQYQQPTSNEVFDEQTPPQVMGPSNGYRKRYSSESEKNARVPMSRPSQYQPIHEEQEPGAQNQELVSRRESIKNNLSLNLAPTYDGVRSHGVPVHMTPQTEPHMIDQRRGPYPRHMFKTLDYHSNPATPLRSDVGAGFDPMMVPHKGHTTLPTKPKQVFVPPPLNLTGDISQKMGVLRPESGGSPTRSNPSSPMYDGRPPSFPSSDRRRNYSGQHSMQVPPSPARTVAPVSFGSPNYHPQFLNNSRSRHASGGKHNEQLHPSTQVTPDTSMPPFSQLA